MTNEQILTKAIEKAGKNGFDFIGWMQKENIDFFGQKFYSTEKGWESIFAKMANYGAIYLLIFNHEFAKAFIKYLADEKPKIFSDLAIASEIRHKSPMKQATEEFLQQMVISKDPIQYLKKFL